MEVEADTSGSHSIDEDFSNNEETSQQWIFRHLIEFTDCDDQSAKNLVDGDCTPLIQLLTDMTQTKSLFITITIPMKMRIPSIQINTAPVIIPPTITTGIEKKRISKRSKKKVKKGLKKKKKIKKKKKDIPAVPIEPPPIPSVTVDMLFEWWTENDIPPHEQFIFIIPKSHVPNAETQLDELYHVGYIKNRRLLNAALLCLNIILNNRKAFASKLDLLLQLNEIEDLKISKADYSTRFIIENIARNFNLQGRVRNIESDARSITLILSQTMQHFCAQYDIIKRSRLLIQLSFLDIEHLGLKSNNLATAKRLERALDHLSFLHFLYGAEIGEWTKKIFLYLLDLFSTILAGEITKKSNFMTNYKADTNVGPICLNFKVVVQKFVELSREVFETHEDWAATNKISFSFYIVGILEEEIDSVIEKVKEMNSVQRDMSLDRSAMKATKVIISELDSYLQEKCLESAVESANLESLRSLAATIVKHNKRLERVAALY